MPCRSSRASTASLPRFSRSALARSMPAKRLSVSGGSTGASGSVRRGASAFFTAGLGGGASGASDRPARRLTSRVARCHSACSELGFVAIDKDHVQAAWAVRAQLDALLDIARARRTGNEIDCARQAPQLVGPLRPQEIPAVFVARHDLTGAQQDDM